MANKDAHFRWAGGQSPYCCGRETRRPATAIQMSRATRIKDKPHRNSREAPRLGPVSDFIKHPDPGYANAFKHGSDSDPEDGHHFTRLDFAKMTGKQRIFLLKNKSYLNPETRKEIDRQYACHNYSRRQDRSRLSPLHLACQERSKDPKATVCTGRGPCHCCALSKTTVMRIVNGVMNLFRPISEQDSPDQPSPSTEQKRPLPTYPDGTSTAKHPRNTVKMRSRKATRMDLLDSTRE